MGREGTLAADLRGPLGAWPDWARRAADEMNLHVAAGSGGKWMAIRLSDGGSDGIAYDTRAAAIRHQFHEQLCAYARISSTTAGDMATFITYARQAYAAGYRLPDPDDEPQHVTQHPLLGISWGGDR